MQYLCIVLEGLGGENFPKVFVVFLSPSKEALVNKHKSLKSFLYTSIFLFYMMQHYNICTDDKASLNLLINNEN
jgi:hypothetical protein